MSIIEKKNFNKPDEKRNVGRMKVEVITFGPLNCARHTAAPGWSWATDIKPVASTESCQVNHLFYLISGKLHVVLDDGSEMDFNPGDMGLIPPGHNGWTVGDEPAVWLELPH